MSDDHRNPNTPDEHRLSDGRNDLGERFQHPVEPESRELGDAFTQRNTSDAPRLGEDFADPNYADEHTLAASFADPNSIDDIKLGKSFEQTNSSAKKHHRPVAETVSAPFRKPGSKKVLGLTVAALLVIFLLVLFLGWIPRHTRNHEAEQKASQEREAPEVDVVKVGRSKDETGLTVPGTTTPLTEASVYARANGYLKARYVDIGDHVKKGQLLALIDAPDLDQQVDQAREQVRQAEAQFAQQQTQLALTKVTVDRFRALVERGVFARQDGDQREADYQAQRANVASAERNVEAFRANLRRVIALQSYERVTAPFDGIVTQRNVDVGALISAGGSGQGAMTPMAPPTGGTNTGAAANTGGASGSGPSAVTPQNSGNNGGPLFAIAQVDRLRILVSVPEGYVGAIRKGAPALLHFQEYPTAAFSGMVTRTADSIDQNTRTMLTEIQVGNKDGKLLNGMYAVASFASTMAGEGPITISGDAIAVRNGRNVVGVVRDGVVHVVPVEVGRDFGAAIEILGGLQVGDMVTQTFTDDVVEGQKVDAKMQQPTAGQSGTATAQNQPPGGSTQYGDQAITDRNMQGVSGDKSQKAAQGKPAESSKGESKQ